jgi:hypothetical protein
MGRLSRAVLHAMGLHQGKGKGRGKGSSTDPADEATKQKAAEHLAESRRKLDLVTTAASKLFDDGWVNIYDYTRERVLHSLLDSHDSKPQQSLLGSSSSSSSSSGYFLPDTPLSTTLPLIANDG